MSTFSHVETQLALRAVLLAVAGIPSVQAFDNKIFTPAAGTPYLEEAYVPATTTLLTTLANGVIERTGLYVIRWYDLANSGITTIRDGCDAILAAFAPGSAHVMPSGLVLRIRGDVAPWAGQLIPQDTGFTACVVTIPWRVYALGAVSP